MASLPPSSSKAAPNPREALQRQTQQDWANREYVELIAGSIKRITEFLNAFSTSCSGRLASLNSRLNLLERKVSLLESRVDFYYSKKRPLVAPSSVRPANQESDEEDSCVTP